MIKQTCCILVHAEQMIADYGANICFLCLTPVLVMKKNKRITVILIALSHFRGRVVAECPTCGTCIITKSPIDKEDSAGKLGPIIKMNWLQGNA